MNIARHSAITTCEICQVRNEAALSKAGYVQLLAWHFQSKGQYIA